MKYARKLANMQLGQRDDWNMFKETPKGEMYGRHAHKIVSSNVRFGRNIQLNQLSSVPNTEFELSELKRIGEKIDIARRKTDKKSSKKLTRLLSAETVLKTSQMLRNSNKRMPLAFQVLGNIALIHGMDSEELKDAARYLHAASVGKKKINVLGDASAAYRSIICIPIAHKNYLSEIDSILLTARKALSSKEILAQLHKEINDTELNRINASLQILEFMGIVQKLPRRIEPETSSGTPLSMWISREYKPSTTEYLLASQPKEHYLNPYMDILHSLYTGPKQLSKLYRRDKYHPGDPNSIYPHTNIQRVSRRP